MKTHILLRSILAALLIPVAAATGQISSNPVTNTNDSGDGSLRQAIASAVSGATIKFSLPAGSVINLTSGGLVINKNLDIVGPGANLLTVQRSTASGTPTFRVLTVAGNFQALISGLTIANGNHESAGGGIYNGSDLLLDGVAVSGNSAQVGGGIFNEGNLTLTRCSVAGNTAHSSAGGIYTRFSLLTVANSTISGNSANGQTASSLAGQGQGGGIYCTGPTTLYSTTISNNSAIAGGGGVFNGNSTLKPRNTIIALNTAPTGPDISGALTSDNFNLIGNSSGASITPPPSTSYDQIGVTAAQLKLGPLQDNGGPTKTHALLTGSPAIDRGTFAGAGNSDQRGFVRTVDGPNLPNADTGAGGATDIGAYEVQADSLAGCFFLVENRNDSGPGSLRYVIANVCAGSTITFAPDVRGTISLTTGELPITKVLTIQGPGAELLTVERNASAGNFRVINISASDYGVTISGLRIANGHGSGAVPGGGIAVNNNARIANCIISGNSSDTGGGIYLNAVLTITDSTISGNFSGGAGGGIYSLNGRMTIDRCTVSENTAALGGGIFSSSDGGENSLTITNSTISKNTAAADGAGIFGAGSQAFAGQMTITNSTISDNLANRDGGGIFCGSNTSLTSRNTIIALNGGASGPDVKGVLTSNGFNIVGSSLGAIVTPTQSTDRIGVTAAQLKLGPLQNNGGPTKTLALLSGSVAIDQGHSSGATTDQRGFNRPYDDAIGNADGGDGADIGAFEAAPGLAGNVSTRLPVGTGDNVLIEGFIVQGPAGSTKKIMVRAIGPFLAQFGITDALANPTLEIHDASNATVATNNNWRTTEVGGQITGDQSAEIAASGLAPSDDLESAIIANLAPGQYTAVVRGAGNTAGSGIVDAYDMSAASPAKLVNIATRGLIQPGDNLMIAGFIIQNGGVRAVVRAIGPSLSAFGISNALPDTTLQLRDQNGAIVKENDDWQSDQKQELEITGLQPGNPLEAAIVTTIQPGQYTAQVRGKPETTGIGVVEVYFLQ